MQATYHIVRVFNKAEDSLGNQAVIFLNDNALLKNEQSRISVDITKNVNVNTTCFISQIDTSNYEVQCFNGENTIQCCGHGMIAAAKTVFSITDQTNITINKNISASKIIDDFNEDLVALKLPRVKSRQQNVPAWAKDIIFIGEKSLSPDYSAISENEEGYLLLEFNPAIPLEQFRSMQLDLKSVCEKTNRAIVIIQWDKKTNNLYMRYFAPQYGVQEDIATGSVMRFVADYIEQNHRIKHFAVNQLSAAGGFMKIDCHPETIKITANAYIETC